jgi:3-oxoacyl-(acyl-carrier-protein) synthase
MHVVLSKKKKSNMHKLQGDVVNFLFPRFTAGISNSFGFGGHNSVVVFAPFTA